MGMLFISTRVLSVSNHFPMTLPLATPLTEAAKKFAIRAAVGSVVGVASITIGLPILGFTSAGVAVGTVLKFDGSLVPSNIDMT